MKEVLITSSTLILALMVLRLLFSKKVRRTWIYSAWILVALRLLIPVQIGQLQFSVLTATQAVTQNIEQVATRPVSGPTRQEVFQDIVVEYVEKDPSVFAPQVQEQIQEEISQGTTNPAEIADKIQQKYPQQEIFVPQVEQQVQQQVKETQTAPTLGQIAKTVWLIGVAGMAMWFLFVNLRHGWLLRKAARKLDCQSPIPAYVSEEVASPCLVGLVRPLVYVTPRCAENPQLFGHVLKHELTHYRHGDHIWSLVRCVCLCIYWFDPLVWVAAYLSRRDCELACDEGAMKGLGEKERLAYGKTLLEVVSHAANPGNLLQTATAMNETMKQLKERVNYIVRKPKFSITAAICMVLVCALIAGCVAAGPTSAQNNPPVTTPTTPTTQPNTTAPNATQPQMDVQSVKTLASDMHFSIVKGNDLSQMNQFEGKLDLTVTEYTNGSVSMECVLPLTDGLGLDFTNPGNTFTVQHEELGLPYYCATASIYQSALDGYAGFSFAVDLDKGYMIFMQSANIMLYYVVASVDPAVDPLQIAEHFSMFFKLYDYSYVDTGIVTDFYYDYSGVWISENDEILGEMPIYITGTLPAEYEDGDNVQMELNFIWPQSSGYRNEGPMTYTGAVDISKENHHPNFYGTGTLYDSNTKEQITFSYNIFPLDGVVILHINGKYLLSVPWDTSQAVARLNYYKKFIFTEKNPADPNRKELKKFNELFGAASSWYNRALTCEYTSPTQISLEYLFYAGFPGESRDPTNAEWVQLKGYPGFNKNYDLMRLPVDKMNAVLQELFGITLEDMEDVAFADVVYLESTNCYYHMVTDFRCVENFNAIAVEYLDDGTIRVKYTQDEQLDEVYAVTLMPYGDGYRILSNVRCISILYLIDLPEEAQIMIVGEDTYNSANYNFYASHTKVYGAFHGVYALCPSPWSEGVEYYYDQVYGYVFKYSSDTKMRVYTSDGSYSLEEAFSRNIIIAGELKKIFENYCFANPGWGWIEDADF